MLIFILFATLFFLSTSALSIEEHILSQLNTSIDPCDDFYAHATSANSKSISDYYFHTVVQSYELSGIDNYTGRMLNNTGLSDENPRSNYSDFKTKLCSKQYVGLNDLFDLVIKEDDCLNILAELEEKIKANEILSNFKNIISVLATNSRAYDNIKKRECRYPTKKLDKLTNSLIDLVIEEVENTEWLQTNNVSDSAIERLQSLQIRDIMKDLKESQDFLMNFDNLMAECLQDLDKNSLNDVLFCRTVLIGIPYYLRLSHKPLILYNAAYMNRTNELVFYLPFNEMAKDDHMAAKMATGLTLLHELGHTVYHAIIEKYSSEHDYPDALSCVQQSMNTVCNLFEKNDTDYCILKNNTLNEDAADFSMIMLLNKFANQFSRNENETIDRESAKMLFYSFAQSLGLQKELDVNDEHSYNGDRINMIARQSPLFAQAFQCKPGDRMVADEDEKCFLSGPNAPKTFMLDDDDDDTLSYALFFKSFEQQDC